MKKRRWMAGLLVGMLLVGSVGAANVVSEDGPLATYTSKDGEVDLVECVLKGDVLGVVVDYTNTTEKNVSPAWRISLGLFQNGIKMGRGKSFEIEGVRDGYTEIRPGATLRMAEFFEIESRDPVEVEISASFSLYDEPLYVTVSLDSGEVKVQEDTTKKSKKEGKGSSSLLGGLMDAYEEVYEEVIDGYSQAYEEVMDEYENVLDEYTNALGEIFGSFGK